MKNTDKIVVFDWGGVVESHSKGEHSIFTSQVDIINRLNADTKLLNLETIINNWKECACDKNGKYISEINNQKDIEEWFERIKRKFELKCSYEEFYQVYQEETDKVEYYKNVVELAHSLKDKCIIGILSNLSKLDKNRIDKQYNLSKFDYVWLSFELNCKKSDEQIYIKVENECKIKPENILFIDDKDTNIIAAQKRGWKTCMADGHEIDKIKKSIDSFLN